MDDLIEILWEGTSHDDLMDFPQSVRHDIGYQLHLVQSGEMPSNWKPLAGLGKNISGVYEIRIFNEGNFIERHMLRSSKILSRYCIVGRRKRKRPLIQTKL